MRATATDGRGAALVTAAGTGALAGLAGVAVMTVAEKVEQTLTHRPDSYVPARTLLVLLGSHQGNDRPAAGWNHLMHWGTGAALGALRGVWASTGMRGPRANLAHTVVRLAFDQTMENATGEGAPPHTWDRTEQAADMMHKGIYAFATGVLADLLIAPQLESRRGTRSH